MSFKQYVEIGDLITPRYSFDNEYGMPCIVLGINLTDARVFGCSTILDVMLPDGNVKQWKLNTLTHYPLDDVYGNRDLHVDMTLTSQPFPAIKEEQ